MLASTPTKDYVSLRNPMRDSSMSPSCRPRHSTPPRLMSDSAPSYDSPMLTPSPLRQRPLFASHFAVEDDDLFLQSPYKSPGQVHHFQSYTTKPQPIAADDVEGSIFLTSSSAPFSPFFPPSTSQPLRTPVKQAHRTPNRSALAVKHENDVSYPTTTSAPSAMLSPATRVGVGTKRKSVPHGGLTPLRPHSLTPLKVATSGNGTSGIAFDHLAPLAPPRFTTRTPQTRAETDAHIKRQTATLTKLKITDLNDSGEEFVLDNDSGCEMEEDDSASIFLAGSLRMKGKSSSLSRALGRELIANKSKAKDEVVEAISPGGHVNKRRARSRPVSAELLESAHRSPSPRLAQKSYTTTATARQGGGGGVVFPSSSKFRARSSSNSSSSSEPGSPLPRRRTGGAASVVHPSKLQQNPRPVPTRAPLNRLESVSSATLFFGPAIAQSDNPRPTLRSRVNTAASTSSRASTAVIRPETMNRHSYAGPDSGNWNTIQSQMMSPSPQSSPFNFVPQDTSRRSFDDEEDLFFKTGLQSSFIFSVTGGTPSPRSKANTPISLPKKFKPRDSGVVISDDEDELMSISGSVGGDFLNVMPRASTSVSSIYSDGDEGLITPGVGPELGSGWPGAAVFISGADDNGRSTMAMEGGVDVDAFIMRTLASAAKGQQEASKKVPGTPVKKVKTTYLAGDRPWQSAVAAKVGIGFDWDGKKPKIPRKSLPAAFSALGKKRGKPSLDQDTDSEGEEDSPSGRKEKYVGLGLGQPPPEKGGLSAIPRTRWLMRRSSSGAFSSGSESTSIVGTPTRMQSKDWHLPLPNVPSQANRTFKLSPVRSVSGSSNSSVATLNSPTNAASRQLAIPGSQRRSVPRPSTAPRRPSEPNFEEQAGRFEREFVEIDEVGSGQFGKVIKVRRKCGDDDEVFAIKKSKRFEGVRHRLRLREEVDILKHISLAATSNDEHRHPNVLTYIDSWEEDEALYIQTELCESGNLARFLWEYGRVFPRLDEPRVWKIIVDLSNGLRFIHDASVIHLDLKPANVFVTAEGRFKIGDFGMASLWPRPNKADAGSGGTNGFEREGDKVYLAPEVLQGKYGKAADVFSFGMTILETASNIVVPDQGEAWHRLRQEDFSQVDLGDSPELLELIAQMMRTDPSSRMSAYAICAHPVVSRARAIMERTYTTAKMNGTPIFNASPLGSVPRGFLEEILDRRISDCGAMDLSP